eukprot:3935875-Rhodomonas_salina.1
MWPLAAFASRRACILWSPARNCLNVVRMKFDWALKRTLCFSKYWTISSDNPVQILGEPGDKDCFLATVMIALAFVETCSSDHLSKMQPLSI